MNEAFMQFEEEKKANQHSPSNTRQTRQSKSPPKTHTCNNNEEEKNDKKMRRLKKLIEDKRDFVKGSQSVTKNNANNETSSEDKTCAICLSDITDELGRLDGCIHKFCYSCIKDWSDVTNECPLCKVRFSELTRYSLNNEKLDTIKVEFKKQVYEYDGIGDIDEEADDFCYVCGASDNYEELLICDECEFKTCHTYCCDPPLTSIPLEEWFCTTCKDARRRVTRPERPANNTSLNTRRSERSRRQSERNPRFRNEQYLRGGSLLQTLLHQVADDLGEYLDDENSRGSNTSAGSRTTRSMVRGDQGNNRQQEERTHVSITRTTRNVQVSNNSNNALRRTSSEQSRRIKTRSTDTRTNTRRNITLEALEDMAFRRTTRQRA
jgi:hypothetical protein